MLLHTVVYSLCTTGHFQLMSAKGGKRISVFDRLGPGADEVGGTPQQQCCYGPEIMEIIIILHYMYCYVDYVIHACF